MNNDTRLGVRSLIILMMVISLAFILIIAIHHSFIMYSDDLDEEIENHNTEISIGKNILTHIQVIESHFYEIALSKNVTYGKIAKENILLEIKHLREAFDVLENGGEIIGHIELNIVGKDKYEEAVYYTPTDDRNYSIEAIDLNPKLDLTLEKVDALIDLLIQYEKVVEESNSEEVLKIESELVSFMKYIPPHFIRMKENASRIIYESKFVNDEFQKEVLRRKDISRLLEETISGIILIIVLGFGYFFGKKIVKINNQLSDYAIEVEQASLAKTLFVTSMSHEIRTPLNAVIGFSELLERSGSLDEKDREFASIITRSGKSLLNIVNDILDFSKIESDNLQLECVSFHLYDLLEEVVELHILKAEEKEIKLNYLPDSEIPNFLFGDPVRLKQVLINLISNSIKFTPHKGYVELSVDMLEHDMDQVTVRFTVTDTGIGIDPSNQKRIFKPFEQGDLGTTRKYGGTGLGLVISSNIIKKMGSEIKLVSDLDKGSEFYFDIIFQVDTSSALEQNQNQWKMKFGICCKETTCPIIRSQIKKYLESYGEIIDDFEQIHYEDLNCIFVFYNDDIIKRLKWFKDNYVNVPIIYAGDISRLNMKERSLINDVIEEPIYSRKVLSLLSRYYEKQIGHIENVEKDYLGNVLVAEDNKVNQHLVGILLKNLGLKACFADNGEEAVKLAKSVDVDLILMDLHMPIMDGMEATELIQSYYKQHDIEVPILALTADVFRIQEDVTVNTLFDGYLLKPIEKSALDQLIKKYFSKEETSKIKIPNNTSYQVSEVVNYLGLDLEDLLLIIDEYFTNVMPKINILYHYLESSQKDLKFELHGLLGSTVNLRFNEIANYIRQMEAAVDNKDLSKSDIDQLKLMLQSLKTYIDEQVQTYEK